MEPRARPDAQPRGRVALVELEADVEAHEDDADELEEVDVEEVRLRAVRLPVLQVGGVAQRRDAGAGLVGADGPGGEGGDFAEAGGGEGEGRFVCGEEVR